MILYLMRHGQAESFAPTDEERVLTPRGIEQSRAMGAVLSDPTPTGVWSSPFLRARETAAVVADAISFPGALQVASGITPDDDPRAVLAWLSGLEGVPLIVSHNPFISGLASLLLHGHYQGPEGFSTADVACLHLPNGVAPGAAELRWLRRAP